MGVMIQCETCKVWQHCPCVGLGDGLVTPDKYYCDSCRPENHPYHVIDGVLMTNAENTSSAVASLKIKSPKTKSSARESKVSTDRDSQPDTTATENNHQGNVTRASKRRKKTDSTLDDLDQLSLHNTNNSNTDASKSHTEDESEITSTPVTAKSNKKPAGSSSKGSANGSKRKKGAMPDYELSSGSASSAASAMMTPVPVQLEESLPIADQDSESASSASTSAAPSTRRNARSSNNKKNSRAAPADDVIEASHIVPASKRRRTAESTTRSKEDSVLETEDEDKASDKDISPTEAVAEVPATRSSRKGHSTRANKKVDPVDDEQAELMTPAEESPSASEDTARADSVVSHPEVVKRGGALRKAQQNHGHHHSRHGSPAGTPQPSQIITIQPTKVKFPSAKMTIADMNKRIKQLQDYVSHARAEMSEMKKNREAAAAAAMARANAATPAAAAACEDSTMAMADNIGPSSSSSESQPAWLSTPPRSVHETSRSESLDPTTQPSTSATTTAMSTTTTSEQKQGGQPPMTPPPQNEAGSCNTNTGNMNCDNVIGSKDKGLAVTSTISALSTVSCLEQIDKLTHDLLHFQRKFGNKSDI
ncbi:hypothetical protein BG015_005006 [Linnemannia schmuckeri]|uniref:Zinc finger PHD-type domain-containing protein n=1 Tax=Linnemannia schmuckeri TaxID=64567 RepID=A0A9P5VCS8_9FUNG|nr:hypothetical protein BG015_005006 [Linnemannia schmuckeri]